MIFKIKKGKHKSKPALLKFWLNKKVFNFDFELDTSCWYPKKQVQHSGISKICGVSFGTHAENLGFLNKIFPRALINSVVIGWMPDHDQKNRFNLYLINDNRGVETRPQLPISIVAGQNVRVRIERGNSGATVTVNGQTQFIELNGRVPFGYYLKFYHGGKDAAYWDMYAKMNIY